MHVLELEDWEQEKMNLCFHYVSGSFLHKKKNHLDLVLILTFRVPYLPTWCEDIVEVYRLRSFSFLNKVNLIESRKRSSTTITFVCTM